MAVKLNISLVLLLILFGANCETIYVKFFDTPIKGPDKDHPFKVGVISYGIVPLRKPEILPVVNKKINPMIFVEGSDYVCIEQHTDLDLYTTKQEIDKVKFIFKRSMDFRGFSDFDKSSYITEKIKDTKLCFLYGGLNYETSDFSTIQYVYINFLSDLVKVEPQNLLYLDILPYPDKFYVSLNRRVKYRSKEDERKGKDNYVWIMDDYPNAQSKLCEYSDKDKDEDADNKKEKKKNRSVKVTVTGQDYIAKLGESLSLVFLDTRQLNIPPLSNPNKKAKYICENNEVILIYSNEIPEKKESIPENKDLIPENKLLIV